MNPSLAIDVPSSRLSAGRVAAVFPLDDGRARRLISGQLPWLHRLDDASRATCIDEVLAAVQDNSDVAPVLARWAPPTS